MVKSETSEDHQKEEGLLAVSGVGASLEEMSKLYQI